MLCYRHDGHAMKITTITELHRGLYAHICPLCGVIYASASELANMPEFSICDCDKNEAKEPAYELFDKDGYVMIRRNKPPRFVGKVTMGKFSDIEEIGWMDNCTAIEAARALRKAGEFLIKSSRHD